ncbi:MFS general substrate transporter [Aspergillus sclerotioniger CBS 115572]|uniref:MFS general substrate transporter n=1 Tax=Aspergillus sclerotioniger CBS 115572 TaxID=1450535 RepID=A0A317X622_9EURO|nr:MFS general substrate transporter [Aspergillus sclerotioniger CBS 115572]PWY93007.1 MFS general substrate transporter [Aspergillus sclerotioniger CBS 115572]
MEDENIPKMEGAVPEVADEAGSTVSSSSGSITVFGDHDPTNPVNFSRWRKFHVIAVGILFTFNSTFGSSIASGAQTEIKAYFNVTSEPMLVLLTSLYMVGFTVGPLVFGPLSEHLGRRTVLRGTYIGYTAFTLGCALAPTFPGLLVFRLLSGLNAAAPNAITGGLYADVFNHPDQRGKAMSIFMAMTVLGPELGPVISNYVSEVSWRWAFWVALIVAGAGMPVIFLMPETYAPVLLQKKALKNRGLTRITTIEKVSLQKAKRAELLRVFSRPFMMLLREPILLFSSLYMALIYALLYLFFQAYPIVFRQFYGLSVGLSGLAFVPMIIGSFLAFSIFLAYSSFHSKAIAAKKSWAMQEEYRRLPLAAVGAPLITIGLFWLAWMPKHGISPIAAMIAGIWFGTGYLLIFIAMLNYLTDAYKSNSASAQAAASTMRSAAAVGLPLAATPMYDHLGIHWASSLLGFVSLALAMIPFAFIKWGGLMRARSPFCATMAGT